MGRVKTLIFKILLLAIAFSSIVLWSGFVFYIMGWFEEYNIVKSVIEDNIVFNDELQNKFGILGTIGDFFNIVTSIATVLTVVLVSYGVYLQKIEIRGLKEGIEKGEKINRTLKFIDRWNDISRTKENIDQDDVDNYLMNLSLFYNSDYLEKIDFDLIGNMIGGHPSIKTFISYGNGMEFKIQDKEKTLKEQELELRHFLEKNSEDPNEKSPVLRWSSNLDIYQEKAKLEQKISETKSILHSQGETLKAVERVKEIVKNDS